ncbi:MAG: elongation factor P [Lentimicrobiaceae bacterium]|jgi:elongation factor P|nr:elongation factor P [Lentimicrobiaceae bacterium]MCP4909086.1 elongation factor P [Bacteroidota bacterium]MBT3453410.1 elongation factor P [Lentimicrobiaceae bacterium]MBT3819409.1 elongation factor P [Lentimicrobiaceae bacterium]MBT4061992.1 elongation factor P [Lentimicrobiaceae bacterium]
MASTADFRNGLCILHNGELYTIAEFQHVKPGKGPAFVRTKLRNVKTGRILTNTFTSGVKIEIQRVERRQYQYLYSDGDIFHFMNSENFEQTFLDKSLIPAPDLLKEGQEVTIAYHGETDSPILCDMPAYVVLEITYTEPGERGNTATNTFKDATVETNATVKVPLFINTGDKIKIDTRTGAYSERVKS